MLRKLNNSEPTEYCRVIVVLLSLTQSIHNSNSQLGICR